MKPYRKNDNLFIISAILSAERIASIAKRKQPKTQFRAIFLPSVIFVNWSMNSKLKHNCVQSCLSLKASNSELASLAKNKILETNKPRKWKRLFSGNVKWLIETLIESLWRFLHSWHTVPLGTHELKGPRPNWQYPKINYCSDSLSRDITSKPLSFLITFFPSILFGVQQYQSGDQKSVGEKVFHIISILQKCFMCLSKDGTFFSY